MNNSTSLLSSLKKINTALKSISVKNTANNNNNNHDNTTTITSSDSWFDKIDSTMLMYVAGGALVLYLIFRELEQRLRKIFVLIKTDYG